MSWTSNSHRHPNRHRFWMVCAVACSALLLGACSEKISSTFESGSKKRPSSWYLEKTSDTTANITWVDANGKEQSWEGQFFDDSPKGTILNPLKNGEDNGLFRWAHEGCSTLSFVLITDAELKCTTCVDPGQFVPYTMSCPLDQQRLPVQAWRPKGLVRPNKVG